MSLRKPDRHSVRATATPAGREVGERGVGPRMHPPSPAPRRMLWCLVTLAALLLLPGGVAAGAEGVAVQLLALAGEAATPQAEISGLAWHGEALLLLPQYPARFGAPGGGSLFCLPRQRILDVLDGRLVGPLAPEPVPFDDGGLPSLIEGFEGYEALAVEGDRAFLTIEARSRGAMQGYLVLGTVRDNPLTIELDPATLRAIPLQTSLPNTAEETLVVVPQGVATLHEANGGRVNPRPQAHLFSRGLVPLGTLPLPPLEHRITDASSADAAGHFWVAQVFSACNRRYLAPGGDAPAGTWEVEGLIELCLTPEGIVRTDRAPIYLALEGNRSRNWEGLVRLDERGFLVASDRHPGTLLGFVPAGPPGHQ